MADVASEATTCSWPPPPTRRPPPAAIEVGDERAARVALRPAADGERDEKFSDRELEVLAMLRTPLNMREIAEESFISRSAVKTHMRRVYRKLNASSREEAVLAARFRGLLPARDDRHPSSPG